MKALKMDWYGSVYGAIPSAFLATVLDAIRIHQAIRLSSPEIPALVLSLVENGLDTSIFSL